MYKLLWFIRNSQLEKKILDCGAGGTLPPLAIFYQHGFKTTGVDISDSQLEKANAFCQIHDMDLNIIKGDMRKLDFEDESFSHVYSQNSIFHLKKADTVLAMKEMRRVLRTDGYLYVNFLSIDDQGFGEGDEAGPGEWIAPEHGEPTLHSFYSDNELDDQFRGMSVIMKTKSVSEYSDAEYRMATLEYIAKKN
jgi:ubiquinone/menaquinone biosynthesis C-methylase UbiE